MLPSLQSTKLASVGRAIFDEASLEASCYEKNINFELNFNRVEAELEKKKKVQDIEVIKIKFSFQNLKKTEINSIVRVYHKLIANMLKCYMDDRI